MKFLRDFISRDIKKCPLIGVLEGSFGGLFRAIVRPLYDLILGRFCRRLGVAKWAWIRISCTVKFHEK